MSEKGSKFPKDPNLSEKISLKLRRKDKVSLAFGLNSLQIIRLKMHGNMFVDNFSQRPNSIIQGDDLPPKIVKELNNYLERYPETEVETLKSLYDQLLL